MNLWMKSGMPLGGGAEDCRWSVSESHHSWKVLSYPIMYRNMRREHFMKAPRSPQPPSPNLELVIHQLSITDMISGGGK